MSTVPATPPHVLIVEDDVLVTDALRILLESTGHRVSNAYTVREAVEQCRSDRPDVMLLDLTLSDGTGLDVLERLREIDAVPRITAALTGHDDARITERCLNAGCQDVLIKPVSVRVLLTKIGQWLGA